MIFARDMFACPCCGENKIHDEVIKHLNKALLFLQDSFWSGVTVKVTSGYRCAKHNAEVGGAKHSLHIQGLAADTTPILPPTASETALQHALRYWAFALIKAGFTGIGQTYPDKEGHIAIHADLRQMIGKPPQIWAPFPNMKTYGKYTYYFRW